MIYGVVPISVKNAAKKIAMCLTNLLYHLVPFVLSLIMLWLTPMLCYIRYFDLTLICLLSNIEYSFMLDRLMCWRVQPGKMLFCCRQYWMKLGNAAQIITKSWKRLWQQEKTTFMFLWMNIISNFFYFEYLRKVF